MISDQAIGMIERVARVIDARMWETHDRWKDHLPDHWSSEISVAERKRSLDRARAAIQAMREPSAEMLEAARDWSDAKYGRPIGNDAAVGCWYAMLDAAAPEI